MRNFLIAFIGIGLMSLVTSCEKQQVESELSNLAPVNTPLEANLEKAEPSFSEEMLSFTEEIVFKEPTATSRSSTFGYGYQEVYTSDYTLGTGHWVNLQVDKLQLSPDYQYVAVLTPQYGDPDLYVRSHYYDNHGYRYARHRRSSKRRGHHLDESWLNHRDLNPHETHGSFYLHASYNCNFKLSIYQVPARTIWVRHASSHYGQRNIRVRHRGVQYSVQPQTAIALDYDYEYKDPNTGTNPGFSIWECTSSPRHQREYCGWKNNNVASEESYMYSLSDGDTSDGSSGTIGFGVTSSYDD